MRRPSLFVLLSSSLLPLTAATDPAKRDFEADAVGQPPVAKNTWHMLKVEATGDHFVVWYDGNKVLDAKDETFKDAGKVGP